MLQQTRVDTVVPYYERFLARFPDVGVLARADLDAVLGEWAGLGYYSRARNLQAAARHVVERFAGRVPDDVESLRSLPGVGAYTAGAVASIAFDRPEPVVDGNVARVLSRRLGL
ncbi:MAG: A/G-specific adenine glycosylase, partial [Deltaproteobacteria bacterium]